MASNIIITFNNPVVLNDKLEILDSNLPTSKITLLYNDTKDELPVTDSISSDISTTKSFLENKYNATNRYIITADYVGEKITISDNIGNSNFSELFNNTSGRLTTIESNGPVITQITIDNISLIENASPCSLVDIEITTNIQATEITSPVIQPVATNPFTITNISRDSINDIVISLNNGVTNASTSIYVPLLNASSFDINIVNAPNAATATAVFKEKTPNITFQYSLDNVTFYDSSSFSGLSVGNYTMYIKDNIGCSTSIAFEVTVFEPNVFERIPYFQISEQNSLIAKLRQNIDDITVFKNPLNTLSYEEDTQVNNRNFKQLFQKKDGVITQQYRSNYDNTEIKLIDCDNNEVVLLSTKKSNNFDITDVRDVKILEVEYSGGAFVGVQYGVGNTYDPDTLVQNGTYNLSTEVPEFMNVDDYIQIEGAGWFRVVNISYYNGVETLVLDVLANAFPISVTGQTLKGTAIYNKLDYELYEFEFDLNTLDGDYYITYNVTDSEFEDINYRTEWFNVKDMQPMTYLLQYYNTENNETNYSTGIRNKIRVPYVSQLTYQPNDTQDVYLTDTNAVSIETTYRDLYSLDTKPLPQGFIRKIGLAISNDRLFLNGLSLLKNSEIEIERIGLNNVYRTTLQFIRSDYAFTNISDDGSIVLPSGQALDANGDGTGILLAN